VINEYVDDSGKIFWKHCFIVYMYIRSNGNCYAFKMLVFRGVCYYFLSLPNVLLASKVGV